MFRWNSASKMKIKNRFWQTATKIGNHFDRFDWFWCSFIISIVSCQFFVQFSEYLTRNKETIDSIWMYILLFLIKIVKRRSIFSFLSTSLSPTKIAQVILITTCDHFRQFYVISVRFLFSFFNIFFILSRWRIKLNVRQYKMHAIRTFHVS